STLQSSTVSPAHTWGRREDPGDLQHPLRRQQDGVLAALATSSEKWEQAAERSKMAPAPESLLSADSRDTAAPALSAPDDSEELAAVSRTAARHSTPSPLTPQATREQGSPEGLEGEGRGVNLPSWPPDRGAQIQSPEGEPTHQSNQGPRYSRGEALWDWKEHLKALPIKSEIDTLLQRTEHSTRRTFLS
ncbi:hypothetical protein PRIEUP_LOCUS18261, partial [Pristimantis euphronides]